MGIQEYRHHLVAPSDRFGGVVTGKGRFPKALRLERSRAGKGAGEEDEEQA
jgi:hypothetical protein